MNSTRITSMPQHRRKLWRNVCAAGAALSAAMFGVSVVGVLSAGALPAGTAPTAGFAIVPSSGDSATEISFNLTSPNNACPGDSATGDFRWQTYMVPASVDAATLTYNSNSGVIPPAGVTFAGPMYAFTGQDPAINGNTAVSTGQIINVPTLGFGVYLPGDVAPGRYKVGFACSKPPAPGQPAATERYWQQIIVVTASATGGPAQFTWAVEAPSANTTTTTVAPTSTTVAATTTTVARATTTTTAATTTTTTVVGATTTTTTVAGATTTTALASGGPTTTIAGSGTSSFPATGSGSSGGFTTGSGGALPITGRDELPVIVWGILLVVFGRMAVLLARPVKVIPAGHA